MGCLSPADFFDVGWYCFRLGSCPGASSSPGVARPLFNLAHFEQFVGREVKIVLHDKDDTSRRRYTGVIKAVKGDNIVLVFEGEDINLAFDQIMKANLVPDISF